MSGRRCCFFFFFQAEDGIRDYDVTGVQTCALPISTLEKMLRDEHGGMRSWKHQEIAHCSPNISCWITLYAEKVEENRLKITAEGYTWEEDRKSVV